MNLKISLLALPCFCFFPLLGKAQNAHNHLRDGDRAYKKENYEAAELDYRKSIEADHTFKGAYNLGNSMYKQQRFEEAKEQFNKAAQQANSDQERAHAYHNLGNAMIRLEDYAGSVDAYKKALKLNPGDKESQLNLALAQAMIPPVTPPPQAQPESSEDQNEQQNQQEQQQQQSDSSPSDNNSSENPEDAEQQGEQPPPSLDEADAEKLLEIAQQEEQKTIKNQKKGDRNTDKPSKDW